MQIEGGEHLAHRKDIIIKTKYSSKYECMENCRDINKKTIMAMSLSRAISGTVSDTGEFCLSSRSKGAAMFEFIGEIEENKDGVFMVGEIQPKPYQVKLIYFMTILFTLMGFGFVLSFEPVLVLFGIFFMIIPWINIIALKTSDHLYKLIKRKVT